MGLLYSILDSLGNNNSSLIFEPYRKMDSKTNCVADKLIILNDLSKKIPTEVISKILEYMDLDDIKTSKSKTQSYNGRNNDDTIYLTMETPDFMQGGNIFEVDKVIIRAITKDQGWSSFPELHGSRESHSWLELSINDNPEEEGGHRYTIMRNIHASREFEHVQIVYPLNNAVVQSIRNSITQDTNNNDIVNSDLKLPTACLRLHTRSQYPGWRCLINFAEIVVFYRINFNKFVQKFNLESTTTTTTSSSSNVES